MSDSAPDASSCPVCHRVIRFGEVTRACARCGALHHAACLMYDTICGACRSREGAPPEVVVHTHEVRTARVSPPPDLSLRQQPPASPSSAPTVLAAFAAAACALAFLAAAAAISSAPAFGLAAAALSSLGLFLALLAAIIRWNVRRVHGFALGIIVLSTLLLLFSAFTLSGETHPGLAEVRLGDFQLSRPAEEELARVSAPIAAALRANVVTEDTSALGELSGSGVVVGLSAGKVYVLTNKHVIGGKGLSLHFQNGVSSPAQVAWSAPGEIDLAIVEAVTETAAVYQTVPVRSGLAGAGESSFAIGNPLGMPWSYTQGVISSLRTLELDGRQLLVYQTQTPINPGNSGGGLYDAEGRLIGINTWTQDKSFSEGISLSISTVSLLSLLTGEDRERFLARVIADTAVPN